MEREALLNGGSPPALLIEPSSLQAVDSADRLLNILFLKLWAMGLFGSEETSDQSQGAMSREAQLSVRSFTVMFCNQPRSLCCKFSILSAL
jgi:hypothetical protein